MIILKELNYILDKNSIKYLISFHKKNKNNLFFNKEHFYNACSKNNLNIIKYIYYHLENKNIEYQDAIENSCNQYNKKLILWLFKKANYTNEKIKKCLFYCINNNNLKLFTFLKNKYNFNIFHDDNYLFIYSIKKKKIKFIEYFLEFNFECYLKLNFELIKNIVYLNNIKIIKKILDKFKKINSKEIFIKLLENCVKLGFNDSINFLLEFDYIHIYLKEHISKYIYYSFMSNDLNVIKNLLSLKYENNLDYNFLNSHFIIQGNTDILNFILEKDKSINLYNYINLEKIFKNRLYNVLLFIFKKKPYAYLSKFYFNELKKNINDHYFKIILNIEDEDIKTFFKFIHFNNITINSDNILYLVNNLLIYGQINKIDFIKFHYPYYICFDNNSIISDSIKSNKIECIKYAINIRNKNIDDYKYDILYHSYINGLKDIINEYDENNEYEFSNYDTILIKNILKNDIFIINKILNKSNFDKNIINNDIIDIIFKLGNKDLIYKFLPFFNSNNLNNQVLIDELINNENYETLDLIKDKIDTDLLNSNLLLKICKFGNIKFIDWFLNLNLDYNNYINIAFNTLILYGHYDQSIYFYEKKNHKDLIDLADNNFHLFFEIVKNNNLKMVHWFLENFDDINNIQFLIYIELQDNGYQLIKYDNHEILNIVISKFRLEKNYNFLNNLFIYCLENYKNNSINFLDSKFKFIFDSTLKIDYKNIFINSIKYKYYHIITFLIKNIKNYSWLYIISYVDDNFEYIFNYLLENFYDYLNINEDLFFNILYNGKINYIKIFLNHCSDVIDLKKISEDDYIILLSYNNPDLLDYVYSLNKLDFSNNIDLLKIIINLNKSKLLKWFLDKFTYDDLHTENDFCFQSAIVYKNITILDLLYQYDDKVKFDSYKIDYLKIASKVYSLNIFLWISNKIENIDYTMENNILINNALSSNNLYIFKHIINNSEFDINYNDGILISTAFGNNYNEIIKFLFEKFDNINVLVRNQIIIKYAVEDADIEMIDLLYDYNNNFDLSLDNEYLFRIAAKMNHLEVVKWLFDKKKDIDYTINNHEVFYYICDHGYKNIALYLSELNPELYKVIIKDNEIETYHVNKNLTIINCTFTNHIDKCPICIDVESNIITNCNHQYCNECIKNLNNKNLNFICPLCRTEISELKHIKKIESEN